MTREDLVCKKCYRQVEHICAGMMRCNTCNKPLGITDVRLLTVQDGRLIPKEIAQEFKVVKWPNEVEMIARSNDDIDAKRALFAKLGLT